MINLVIALPCEARPIIDNYRLKLRHDVHEFKVYESDKIRLVLSGIGKTSAAVATAYLFGLNNRRKNDAWLNIGIAGHQHHPLGSGFIIHKITEHSSGRCWYPYLLEKIGPGAELLSVDEAKLNYHDSMMIDMEGAGFYETAMRFSTCELIHSYKVVSDNYSNPIENVSKQTTHRLIADNMNTIGKIIDILSRTTEQFSLNYPHEEIVNSIIEKWHFSFYQKNRLENLLKRWAVLSPEQEISPAISRELLTSSQNSHDVISYLEKKLDSLVS